MKKVRMNVWCKLLLYSHKEGHNNAFILQKLSFIISHFITSEGRNSVSVVERQGHEDR